MCGFYLGGTCINERSRCRHGNDDDRFANHSPSYSCQPSLVTSDPPQQCGCSYKFNQLDISNANDYQPVKVIITVRVDSRKYSWSKRSSWSAEVVVYYESRKWELKTRPMYECRCDERLKTKSEKSTRLTYTGLFGEMEHPKIETRLIGEMFPSVMGEYVFLKW